MKKMLLLLSMFIATNCTGFSQIVDVGYKENCIESYCDTIYGTLLSIIDSTILNELIKENIEFKVCVRFNTKTGYPDEILIADKSSVLPDKKKKEYKSVLFATQFYLCHSEHDVYKKPAKEVFIGETVGIITGFFSKWWYRKTVLCLK